MSDYNTIDILNLGLNILICLELLYLIHYDKFNYDNDIIVIDDLESNSD